MFRAVWGAVAWPSRLLLLRHIPGPKWMRLCVRAVAVGLNTVVLLIEAACLGALGPTVTHLLCPAARAFLDLPIRVDQCSIWPLWGYVSINGLSVGNPARFVGTDRYYAETPMLTLRRAVVNLGVADLLKGRITVERLDVEGLRFLYAVDAGTSNVEALLAQVGLDGTRNDTDLARPKPRPTAQSGSESHDHDPRLLALRLKDNRVTLRHSVLGVMTSLPLPLPPIDMTDADGEGLFGELTTIIRGVSATVEGLTAGGEVLMDGGRAVLEGAGLIGSTAAETGEDVLRGVGDAAAGAAAEVGSTALEGAGAVGNAAADLGGTVLKGAETLFDGALSVFGEDEKMQDSSP